MIDKELLKILACPYCKKGLDYSRNELKCSNCKRVFPVKKGIPVLLKKT